MSPLDPATMQVMITESVILPLKPLEGASMTNPPPAIFNLCSVCVCICFPINSSSYYLGVYKLRGLRVSAAEK